jgi:hypothetical protein
MKHSAVYMKTDKGLLEVATRQHRLPSRSRSLLIMIDGKRTAIDVLANSSSIGEAETHFRQLVEDGFVYELTSAELTPIGPPPAIPSASGQTPDTLLELKKYVLQILRDVLGREDAAAFRLLVFGAQSPKEIGGIIPLHRDIPWSSRNRHRFDDYRLLGRRLGQEQDSSATVRG